MKPVLKVLNPTARFGWVFSPLVILIFCISREESRAAQLAWLTRIKILLFFAIFAHCLSAVESFEGRGVRLRSAYVMRLIGTSGILSWYVWHPLFGWLWWIGVLLFSWWLCCMGCLLIMHHLWSFRLYTIQYFSENVLTLHLTILCSHKGLCGLI